MESVDVEVPTMDIKNDVNPKTFGDFEVRLPEDALIYHTCKVEDLS